MAPYHDYEALIDQLNKDLLRWREQHSEVSTILLGERDRKVLHEGMKAELRLWKIPNEIVENLEVIQNGGGFPNVLVMHNLKLGWLDGYDSAPAVQFVEDNQKAEPGSRAD